MLKDYKKHLERELKIKTGGAPTEAQFHEMEDTLVLWYSGCTKCTQMQPFVVLDTARFVVSACPDAHKLSLQIQTSSPSLHHEWKRERKQNITAAAV